MEEPPQPSSSAAPTPPHSSSAPPPLTHSTLSSPGPPPSPSVPPPSTHSTPSSPGPPPSSPVPPPSTHSTPSSPVPGPSSPVPGPSTHSAPAPPSPPPSLTPSPSPSPSPSETPHCFYQSQAPSFMEYVDPQSGSMKSYALENCSSIDPLQIAMGQLGNNAPPPQNVDDQSLDFEEEEEEEEGFLVHGNPSSNLKNKKIKTVSDPQQDFENLTSIIKSKFIKFPHGTIKPCTILHLHTHVNDEILKIIKTFDKESKQLVKNMQHQCSLLCLSILHNYTSSEHIKQLDNKKTFKNLTKEIENFKKDN